MNTAELAGVVVALATLSVSIVALYLNQRRSRKDLEKEIEGTKRDRELIEKERVALQKEIEAIKRDQEVVRREREAIQKDREAISEQREAIRTVMSYVSAQKEEIQALRTELSKQHSIREENLKVEKEKVLWQKIIGAAKALGWVLDRTGFFEEDQH